MVDILQSRKPKTTTCLVGRLCRRIKGGKITIILPCFYLCTYSENLPTADEYTLSGNISQETILPIGSLSACQIYTSHICQIYTKQYMVQRYDFIFDKVYPVISSPDWVYGIFKLILTKVLAHKVKIKRFYLQQNKRSTL